jgi:hypothetical protein
MMAYNIKSTFTFEAPKSGDEPWGLTNEGAPILAPLLAQLVAEGKTDGEFHRSDYNTGYRLFSDRASAESWQAALSQCIIEIGNRTDFTKTIEEL